MPCEICGACVGNLITHQRSQACQLSAQINANFRFQCRKCGVFIEKMGQIRSHVCGTVWTDPRLKEYEIRVATLEKLLLDIKRQSSRSSSEISEISSGEQTSKSAIEIEQEIQKTMESEKQKSSQLSIFQNKQGALLELEQPEYENRNLDLKTRIRGLIEILKKGDEISVSGENRNYLLGTMLGEYLDISIGRVPDRVIQELANTFKTFFASHLTEKIKIDLFEGGLIDSCCKPEYISYFNLLCSKFDHIQHFNFQFPMLVSAFEGSIVDMFSPRWWFSPFSQFIHHVVTSRLKPMTQSVKNKEGYLIVYTKEPNGWISDPLGWNLTEKIATILTDQALPIFKKMYRDVFTDLKFRPSWKSDKDLSGLIHLFRNIEMAIRFFDLNHLLRVEIERKCPREDVSLSDDVKVPLSTLEYYQLCSTRIANRVPPLLEAHPLEAIFDDVSDQDLEVYTKNYIQELNDIEMYKSHPKFQKQVSTEKGALKG